MQIRLTVARVSCCIENNKLSLSIGDPTANRTPPEVYPCAAEHVSTTTDTILFLAAAPSHQQPRTQ